MPWLTSGAISVATTFIIQQFLEKETEIRTPVGYYMDTQKSGSLYHTSDASATDGLDLCFKGIYDGVNSLYT